MDRAVLQGDRAVSLFKGGLNCAQAVIASYSEEFGLEPAMAARLAAGLGGGMGRLAQTCGAVSGAVLVLGLKHGNATAQDKAAKEKTYQKVREFVARFKARNGAVVCRDLLGSDISTPDGLQMATQQGLFATRCPTFVRDAAQILAEME